MYPRAKRPAALLDHERGPVTVAALLRVGDVPVAPAHIRKRGDLRAAKEKVVLDYRGEHPSVIESDSRAQPDRRVEVIRITPVAGVESRWIGGRGPAHGIATQIVVEGPETKARVGRENHAVVGGEILSDDEARHGFLALRGPWFPD